MHINLNLTPIETWWPDREIPLIITGPCSAETEEQLLGTARLLANVRHVSVLRAGIWKPRTRPNSFEGVGTIGLQWMKTAREETGLLTTTEVANAKHAEEALKYGIDMLWIGARTSVNPFSVQEIADVLKGVDIPVLVKNPINPDLDLWIGALERINQAGITKLGAIHRGFSTFQKTQFRNIPNWNIPIELKRLIPSLPIICDPSHIAGSRDLLQTVAQKAFDLEMSGLMIESHIDPDNALSDAKQQITPKVLDRLLFDLVLRKEEAKNPEFENILSIMRKQIDNLDEEILDAIAARMKIVRKIGQHKKENDITILQNTRWSEIMDDRISKGLKLELEDDFVHALYELIHDSSIKIQTEILNEGKVIMENNQLGEVKPK